MIQAVPEKKAVRMRREPMPASRPTLYLIAGYNGAGKTTFAKEFLPSIGVVRFLNADEIARGLSLLKPEAVAQGWKASLERTSRSDRA